MTAQVFWDRMAPKYARKPVDDPSAYEQKLALVNSLLRPKDRVLEIGCGTGTTALRLASGVAHYIATDGARAMVGIANAKLGPSAPANVTFLQADAAEQVAGANLSSWNEKGSNEGPSSKDACSIKPLLPKTTNQMSQSLS